MIVRFAPVNKAEEIEMGFSRLGMRHVPMVER
jgi:hypothetical protein